MLTKDETGRFITILADGKFHETVPAGTDGAVLREYETSSGQKGEKWELVYTRLEAKITKIDFKDGEFGEQILITFHDEDNELVLSQLVATNFGEDILKKLPNVDFSDRVSFSPYAFTNQENGKLVRGVTLYQKDRKLFNYFWDNEKKEPKNGYPEAPKGESLTKDDWKIHFLQARKFLVGYAKENIVSKFAGEAPAKVEYPDEEIDPESIPF